MERLKQILVAFDFSPCAEAALAHALRLARSGGEVTVLHAVQPLLYNRIWLDDQAAAFLPTTSQLVDAASLKMQIAVVALEARCPVRQEVVAGHTLGTILEWCERLRPDLLMLGAHSTSDAHRNMGYVASGSIRKAAAPVLAVRAGAATFRNMLVATDFSLTSADALRHALRLARVEMEGSGLEGSRVELFHAHPDPWGGTQPPAWHREAVPDFGERYAKKVREHMDAWARPIIAEEPGVSVSFTAVQHAKPKQAIVERARECGSDLIVLGTKGTSNLHDIVLGSTAEGVLRGSPCSVLSIKPERAPSN